MMKPLPALIAISGAGGCRRPWFRGFCRPKNSSIELTSRVRRGLDADHGRAGLLCDLAERAGVHGAGERAAVRLWNIQGTRERDRGHAQSRREDHAENERDNRNHEAEKNRFPVRHDDSLLLACLAAPRWRAGRESCLNDIGGDRAAPQPGSTAKKSITVVLY